VLRLGLDPPGANSLGLKQLEQEAGRVKNICPHSPYNFMTQCLEGILISVQEAKYHVLGFYEEQKEAFKCRV
jgi:hypothetical protein